MKAIRYEHARELLADAEAYLVAREVTSTSVLGAAYDLLAAERSSATPFLCAVRDRREVVGVGIADGPRKILLACESPRVAELVAAEAHAFGLRPPSVSGERTVADAFAQAWSKRVPCALEVGTDMWLYVARSRPAPRAVPGALRPACESDHDLVRAWVEGFMRDARVRGDVADAAGVAWRWIREGHLHLWQDGEPVSFAGWGARTPSGARISMVYTPEERRGRGYARACVAALEDLLFDDGCSFCCLHADQSNPASNALYEGLGFERVAAVRQWFMSY